MQSINEAIAQLPENWTIEVYITNTGAEVVLTFERIVVEFQMADTLEASIHNARDRAISKNAEILAEDSRIVRKMLDGLTEEGLSKATHVPLQRYLDELQERISK